MENQTKSYVVILPTMNGDPEEFVFIEEENEIDHLSHWEFIHSSDSDSDSVHFDPTVTNFIPIPGPAREIVVGDDHVVDRDESSNDGYIESRPVANFTPMIPGPTRYIVDGDDHVVDRDESSNDGYVEPRPVTNFTPMIPGPARDVVDDNTDHVVDRDELSNDGYVESRPVTNFTPMIPGPIQDGGDAHDDDYDDGYGYGYDLDDELIPKALSGKFGRQRMRKLGKRGFTKTNSKKSPIFYSRPGCVHGKHGLGLKHSF